MRDYKVDEQDPGFSLVYVGTVPSDPTDLRHPRVHSTDFHVTLWIDTTPASGSGTVGCSPNKDTWYIAWFLSRAQSLYCSQFPRLLAKYNWQKLLLLSAGFPFPSPLQTMPCVKHHSQYFNVCPERSDLLTSIYSLLDQSEVFWPVLHIPLLLLTLTYTSQIRLSL